MPIDTRAMLARLTTYAATFTNLSATYSGTRLATEQLRLATIAYQLCTVVGDWDGANTWNTRRVEALRAGADESEAMSPLTSEPDENGTTIISRENLDGEVVRLDVYDEGAYVGSARVAEDAIDVDELVAEELQVPDPAPTPTRPKKARSAA